MSFLTGAMMVPHPPLIMEKIGKGEEKKIQDIIDAYKKASENLMNSQPETVVIISPHAPSYYDYIQLSATPKGQGDMRAFGDPQDAFEIDYDLPLIQEIARLAKEQDVPMGTLGVQDGELDHGTMVPLYFLKDLPENTRFIRIGIGGPDNLMHYKAGMLIAQAAKNLGRKIAVVGSGDLSHCQKAGTHYGYKPCGPAYDEKIMKVMSDADFLRLLQISEKEADEAMVCGQKPFCVMAGIMDRQKPQADNLAHSAEFGVGYGVVSYHDLKEDPARDFYDQERKIRQDIREKRLEKEDALINLARQTIEKTILNQPLTETLDFRDPELINTKSGCFVSIHENGQLRGCIGTTAPTQKNLGTEIVANAIAASTRDPRFPAIAPWELENLEINVDVLQPAEKIDSPKQLDPKKYGVIVEKAGHRGLLLPDLEGVDTIEKQLEIAKQKAGLHPDENGCTLYRFEVERHA